MPKENGGGGGGEDHREGGGAEGVVAGEDEPSDDGVVVMGGRARASGPQFAGQSEEEYQRWRQSVVPARRGHGSGHRLHRRNAQPQEEDAAEDAAEEGVGVAGGHRAGETAAMSSGWRGQDSADEDDALAALKALDQETLSTLYGVRSSRAALAAAAHARREEAALIDAKLGAVRRLDGGLRKLEVHGTDASLHLDCMRASRASGLEVHQPESWYMRLYPEDHRLVLALRMLVLVFCALDVCFVFAEATSYTGCAECTAVGGPYGVGVKGLRGHLPKGFWDAKITLGLLADAVYTLYMAGSCRVCGTALRDLPPQGRRSAVARRYLQGDFPIDLICMFPLYWVFVENPWVRANRFLLIIRALAQTSTFEAASGALSGSGGVHGQELLRFCFALPVVLHVMACCCIMVAWRSMELDGGVAHTLRWLALEEEQLLEDWSFMYLHAQVWSLSTMTGLGGSWAPQTAAQVGWTWAVIVVGVLLCVWVLRFLVVGAHDSNLAAAEFATQREMALAFLKARGVPRGGQRRVQGYFDALSKRGLCFESRAVLDGLPPFVRREVKPHLMEQLLSRFPMFVGVGPEALARISACLVHAVAAKGDSILRTGDRAEHVVFVVSGLLGVTDEQGAVLMDLFEGSLVGDVSALMGIPSPHGVVAATDCELAILSMQDLDCIQEAFPAVRRRLMQRGHVVYKEEWDAWINQSLRDVEADDTERGQAGNGGVPGRLVSANKTESKDVNFKGFQRRGSVNDSFPGGEAFHEMRRSQEALTKTVNQMADAQVKILQHLTRLQAPEAIEVLRQRMPTEPKSERKHKHHHRRRTTEKETGSVSAGSQDGSPTAQLARFQTPVPNASFNEKPTLRPLPDLPGAVTGASTIEEVDPGSKVPP